MILHTPGPWQVSGAKDFVKTMGHKAICRMAQNKSVWVWACEADSLENAANARLIATAPELLEALQRLLRQYEALCNAIPNSELLMTEKAVVNAKTVISKAKGGKQ